MAIKRYPIRNEAGDPIGSTPDPTVPTDGRFWVESSFRAGEVLAVEAANAAFNDQLRDLLTEILAEARETNVHLRHLSGLDHVIYPA